MYFLTLKALALASISVVSASLLMERQLSCLAEPCTSNSDCDCTGYSCEVILGICLPDTCTGTTVGDPCVEVDDIVDTCCPDLTCVANVTGIIGTCQ
ncbi:hypothetical protein C8R42DRAFT_315037 [Lentinula raphanica]|nr:hypothetical protein C8R42DRAFT_315037 [Lentinula raphanica]